MNATELIRGTKKSRGTRTYLPLAFACLVSLSIVCGQAAAEKPKDANRIIQYRGPMPFLDRSDWGVKVELKFEIYRSPNGGTPFWSETRIVPVEKDGWVSLDLGEVEPLPDEAFQTPFRFLSIWKGTVEFEPRKQIASVVYVASPAENKASVENYMELALRAAKAAADQAPGRETRLDSLVNCGVFSLEVHPRPPANWLEASANAARIGARLPSFQEWYGGFDKNSGTNLLAMTGHYEWVIPWVYEPTIHARMHELYRGKPVACYYNELSPLNAYPYRLLKVNSGVAK